MTLCSPAPGSAPWTCRSPSRWSSWCPTWSPRRATASGSWPTTTWGPGRAPPPWGSPQNQTVRLHACLWLHPLRWNKQNIVRNIVINYWPTLKGTCCHVTLVRPLQFRSRARWSRSEQRLCRPPRSRWAGSRRLKPTAPSSDTDCCGPRVRRAKNRSGWCNEWCTSISLLIANHSKHIRWLFERKYICIWLHFFVNGLVSYNVCFFLHFV